MSIIVVSDIHSAFSVLEKIIETEKEAVAVLQCGDFGFFTASSVGNLSIRERALIKEHKEDILAFEKYITNERKFKLPIYGINGNHDDKDTVSSILSSEIIVENLTLLNGKEDGINIDGYNIYSVETSKNIGKKSIVLSHYPPKLSIKSKTFGEEKITSFIKECSPKVLFCGHMHFAYETKVDKTRVYGLPKSSKGDYAVLENNRVVFKSLYKEVLLNKIIAKN